MKKNNEIMAIPGVGPNTAKDLNDLGYFRLRDLKKAGPENMYKKLCELRRQKIDRCELYIFRCAVYFASHKNHKSELLKWWNWKD
jgi:hypothetical protein